LSTYALQDAASSTMLSIGLMVQAQSGYAIKTLEAATLAGAEWLVLCDTNGGTLPHEISQIVRDVVRATPMQQLGIHTHNDSDTAVANALAAVMEGAKMVQGTINGW